jgi:hypothetical protein
MDRPPIGNHLALPYDWPSMSGYVGFWELMQPEREEVTRWATVADAAGPLRRECLRGQRFPGLSLPVLLRSECDAGTDAGGAPHGS